MYFQTVPLSKNSLYLLLHMRRGFLFDNKWKPCWTTLELIFLNTIFVLSHMYPENSERDPSNRRLNIMNMGYISDTARNRTHDLFRPKREPIPLDHSDGSST